MVLSLVIALRDHRTNAVPPQPITDARVAVSLVAGHGLRARPRTTEGLRNPNRIHAFLELRRFVCLPRGDVHGQRSARAVRNQVDFA